MPVETLGLEVRTELAADRRSLVPIEPQPAQAVEDPFDHLLRRAFEIGVFDAENKDPTRSPGEQPVEQRGAGAADVEKAGGRRGKANSGSHPVEGRKAAISNDYRLLDTISTSSLLTCPNRKTTQPLPTVT